MTQMKANANLVKVNLKMKKIHQYKFDKDLLEDILIELEAQPEQIMIGNTVTLAGITENDEINKHE